MSCYLSKTNSVVDAISTRSCYTKKSERAFDFFCQIFARFFLDVFMFHRRYSFRRPQNSAPYNSLICQTVQNAPFPWDAVKHISSYCMHLRQVSKVTNPISDFAFLSTAKSGKSRIKTPFLDQPRPQGGFPWLWGCKANKKRPGNEVVFGFAERNTPIILNFANTFGKLSVARIRRCFENKMTFLFSFWSLIWTFLFQLLKIAHIYNENGSQRRVRAPTVAYGKSRSQRCNDSAIVLH